jgi:hypothetical protein
MTKKIREKIVEWATCSSAHGIPNLSKSTSIITKLIWLFCIIASWTYLLYYLALSIDQYLLYQTNSGIEIIGERPTLFPVVDICNLSPYDKVSEDILKKFDTKKSQKIEKIIDFNSFDVNISYLNEADFLIKSVLNDYEDKASRGQIDLKKYGHDLKDLLVNCRFQKKDCSYNDFSFYHNYFYGNCYRFNSGLNASNQAISLRRSTQPGWKYGLQLELFSDHANPLSIRKGFVILVHNQTHNNYSFPGDNGINISPGFETNVAFTKNFIELLPSPYNDCMGNFNDSFFNYLVNRSHTMQIMKYRFNLSIYEQNYCIKMCLQKYIIDICDCQAYYLPSYVLNKTSFGCNTPQQELCLLNTDANFYNSKANEDCLVDCPVNCEQYRYETQISFSKFPSEWYLKRYYSDLNESQANRLFEHLALVNVYISDMSYSRVYQIQSFTFDQLLATIGGSFGLLTGVSLLTIIEVLELIIIIVEHYLFYKVKH